jgi:hypothetical protein
MAFGFDGVPRGATSIATTLFLALVRQHSSMFGRFAGFVLGLKRNVCEQDASRYLLTPPATQESSSCPVRSLWAVTNRTMPPVSRVPTVVRVRPTTGRLGCGSGRVTFTPSLAAFARALMICLRTSSDILGDDSDTRGRAATDPDANASAFATPSANAGALARMSVVVLGCFFVG